MNYLRLENEIISSVQTLNGHQKYDVLDYINNIKPTNHNSRLYRRRAMKEIREALKNA
ncbi:hypothetical protein SAMN05421640_0325 [Ekhidna lutea]|uniref:Uncharacterized protein n=1 Tax=Ekhidna lutea TaxID=447679 RepID=A0A239ETZ4_EKHLU|nr:hypothetical protein [Ekhidna lutea]SNS48069.1 hypothetical protein SAMN05421640_0325 [Ekhidna lutea]